MSTRDGIDQAGRNRSSTCSARSRDPVLQEPDVRER
jgi:hypothetical protein